MVYRAEAECDSLSASLETVMGQRTAPAKAISATSWLHGLLSERMFALRPFVSIAYRSAEDAGETGPVES